MVGLDKKFSKNGTLQHKMRSFVCFNKMPPRNFTKKILLVNTQAYSIVLYMVEFDQKFY